MSEWHFLLYPGCPVCQSSSCQKVVSCVRLSGASEVTRATHARTTWGPWHSTWGCGSLSGKVTYLPEHRPWNRFYKNSNTTWYQLTRSNPTILQIRTRLGCLLEQSAVKIEDYFDIRGISLWLQHSRASFGTLGREKNTNGHFYENNNKNNLFTRNSRIVL